MKGIRLQALALSMALVGVAHAAPLYKVVPLPLAGLLPDTVGVKGMILNDAGVVVGVADRGQDGTWLGQNPVHWLPGQAKAHVDNQQFWIPTGINKRGDVAAYSRGDGSSGEVFAGVVLDHGRDLEGWPVDGLILKDLDDTDLAVGTFVYYDQERQAVVYEAVTFRPHDKHLTPLPSLGGNLTDAVAINASGDIAGYSTLAGSDDPHAVIFRSGAVIDLQAGVSQAWGLNAGGTVAGARQVAGGWQVFTWQGGQGADVGAPLATFSHTPVINDAGTLAWSVQDGASFVAEGGQVFDVNQSLAAESADWHIVQIDDINASGVVLAEARDAHHKVPQQPVVLMPQ